VSLLVTDKPDLLIVGGYFEPALQLACIVQRLHLVRAACFCENHAAFTAGRLRAAARRFLMGGFRTFIVPGPLQRDYVRRVTGLTNGLRFHQMPNVVNERIFGEAVAAKRAVRPALRDRYGVAESERILLSTMRLEKVKGADLLADAAAALPENCKMLIAGDGSLREDISKSDAVNRGKLRLLGWRAQQEVVDLLALSDAFVLPSRNDAFPLSVVEALWAALPLVLADGVGCHPLALVPDRNGVIVHAGNPDALREGLLRLSRVDDATLTAMGRCSKGIAEERFDSTRIAREFVAFLEATS
jgi:glycosyltransferase involved in cell wall biosynthesis